MKNISIVGSTGSIGVQALDVVRRFPDHFNVVGLSAYSDWETLAWISMKTIGLIIIAEIRITNTQLSTVS